MKPKANRLMPAMYRMNSFFMWKGTYSLGSGSKCSGLGNFRRVISSRISVMAPGMASTAKHVAYTWKVVPSVFSSITTYSSTGPRNAPIWSSTSWMPKLLPTPSWEAAKDIMVSLAGFLMALPMRWITSRAQAQIQPWSPTRARAGTARTSSTYPAMVMGQ